MDAYDAQTLITTTEMAAVATLAYVGADGYPRLVPVVPLLLDEEPAIALTYAMSEVARDISTAPRASLAFADSRLAYVGWAPLSVAVTVEVTQDPEGELFRQELLTQEVRKFPPARQFIDSPLLQRENWWYLPRWILRVVNSETPHPITRRETPNQALLAYEKENTLELETVEVQNWEADSIPIRSQTSGATLPANAPAALFHHDFAVPDMDPLSTFIATGILNGDRFSVESREGSRNIGGRPSLFGRLRAQRDLEKSCRAGIKKYATPER